MPELGESVVEGTVGKWLVAQGTSVEKDQPVVEILTDKADSEVPAPEAGVVTRMLVSEGDVVAVGAPLFEIEARSASARSATSATTATGATRPAAEVIPGADAAPRVIGSEPPASPAVRRLAREHGVDLTHLAGTGTGGRVTRDDVLRATTTPAGMAGTPAGPPATVAATAARLPPATAAPSPRVAPASTQGAAAQVSSGAFRPPPYVPKSGDEVVPFSRRRRIIADHMVYSKLTAPHVVTFAECDLYATTRVRDAHKDQAKKEGANLTFLAFVVQATVRALREFRIMNARVLDDAYVLLGEVNVGIAVDTEEGLVVPVVRHADDLGVKGLARAIDELAAKAREGKLAPDDLAGKTFTVSNPGRRGNLVGGAIISQPNVGILRTGEIKKRVVVVERDGEDLMAIHPVMHLALSYDHRVVDGVAANGFLHRVVELLEAGEFSI